MLIAIDIIWNATLVPEPILLPRISNDDLTPILPGTSNRMPESIGAMAMSFVTLEYVLLTNPTRNAAVETGTWSPALGKNV